MSQQDRNDFDDRTPLQRAAARLLTDTVEQSRRVAASQDPIPLIHAAPRSLEQQEALVKAAPSGHYIGHAIADHALSGMFDYTYGIDWSTQEATCPTCNGDGECDIGHVGFDLTWRGECPSCDGDGKVLYTELATLKADKEMRTKRGWPVPPS